MVQHLFGSMGSLLLGLAVTLACITTSVGLVTACSRFFSDRFPVVSYKTMVAVLCVFSTAVANVGLTQLIALSVPVLVAIYPLAIVLMLLSFLHPVFRGYSSVYIGAIVTTAAISLTDGLKQLGVPMDAITALYKHLPLYAEGIGWLLPAFVGGMLGYLWGSLRQGSTKQKTIY